MLEPRLKITNNCFPRHVLLFTKELICDIYPCKFPEYNRNFFRHAEATELKGRKLKPKNRKRISEREEREFLFLHS